MTGLAKDDVRDKRQAILTAARELFASQGYEETTIAEITRGRGGGRHSVPVLPEYKRLSGRCLPDVEGRGGEVIQSSEILALPVQQVPQAVIEATFRNARKDLRFMNSFQVRWRDSPPA